MFEAKFSEDIVQKVWEKGKVVSGYNSSTYRQDACTAWMKRDEYGNRKSMLGWEIDHITPKSKGGSDDLSNLRPLQWENNASKQEERLVCVVVSQGTKNVHVS